KSQRNRSNSVHFSAHLFQSCLKVGQQSATVGLANLKPVVKSILGGREWTIGQRESNKSVNYHSWNENFIRALASGVKSIFDFKLYPDLKNVTYNVFAVSLNC